MVSINRFELTFGLNILNPFFCFVNLSDLLRLFHLIEGLLAVVRLVSERFTQVVNVLTKLAFEHFTVMRFRLDMLSYK